MESTAAVIRQRAENVLRDALNDEVGVYRMIKSLVATTVKEYRGRFIHELIQNGFDAHPEDTTDGRLAVEFHEDEGPHGVLYVANGGRPLSESNFRRMASLGDSDKPIGVGIGNKGIGFKSVFQICDAPEVYSAHDLVDETFSGFSFRFGTERDLDSFVGTDASRRAKIAQNLSLSLLTVPLESSPDRVLNFRAQGFVTVIRLPVSSQRSAGEVRERIQGLLDSTAPVMLFLDRIASLSIYATSLGTTRVLTRKEESTGGLSRVVLNESEAYLNFKKEVSPEGLAAALAEAVEVGALDERWMQWTAPATVSVAVGEGWHVGGPGAFTFLPMGPEARSPLGGHVNAPFVTDFARLGLDVENPVNRLFLSTIADVCLEAGEALQAARRLPNTVVDLMAWNPDSLPWMEDAVRERRQRTVGEVIHLPVAGEDSWQPVEDRWVWYDGPQEVITRKRIEAVAGASLLDTEQVDGASLARLQDAVRQGDSLAAPPGHVAEWVELVACELAKESLGPEQWRGFYDDLPSIFTTGEELYGRNILLAGSGEMVPADRPPGSGVASGKRTRGRAVFFAPRASGTDDDDAIDADAGVEPPRPLANRIVFLNPDLVWYEGAQQTPGRKFLQDNRLVRQFRTAALLQHIGQVMSEQPSDAVRQAALRFAFQLFASSPTQHSKELTAANLSVPNLDGRWIFAAEARFSRNWNVPGAQDLNTVVEGAPNPTSEIAAIGEQLIGEQSAFTRWGGDLERWISFLKVLGVSSTLPIHRARDARELAGSRLTSSVLAGASAPPEMPKAVVEQWAYAISDTSDVWYPEAGFHTSDTNYWLAGQAEAEAMPTAARRAYARLVARTLQSLAPEHRTSTWKKARGRKDSQTNVPTALWSFVKHGRWMPTQAAGSTRIEFGPPSVAWWVAPEDTMAASYSPLVDPTLRTLAATEGMNLDQWAQMGVKVWGDPNNSGALVDHLTAIFKNGDVPETALSHFRGSLAAAWSALADGSHEWPVSLDQGVVAERSGRLAEVPNAATGTEPLYVTSNKDQSTAARLARELGWAVLTVDADHDASPIAFVELLGEHWSGGVQVAASSELDVFVNGEPWEVGSETPQLTVTYPWLPLLFAACMRFPRAGGLRVGRNLNRLLDLLGAVRLVSASRVEVRSARGDQRLPPRLNGVLPVSEGDARVLVCEGLSDPLTWSDLESLAQGALELIDQDRFKAEVSLVVRDVASRGDTYADRPTNEELADAVGVTRDEIEALEATVFGAVEGVIARISHIAALVWGGDGLDALRELAQQSPTRESLFHLLCALSGDDAQAQSVLRIATGAATPDALRSAMKIPLEEYNASLRTHFPREAPVDYGPAHAEAFDFRVRQHRNELIDRVRNSRFAEFSAGISQPDWLSVGRLTFLECPGDWGTRLDEVPLEMIDASIGEQMLAELLDANTEPVDLPPFEEIRTRNGAPLRKRIADTRAVVNAWCDQTKIVRPAAWSDADYDSSLWSGLEAVGALDFTELSDPEVARWLDVLGAWPAGMSLSISGSAHGLTDADLGIYTSAESEAQARRVRAAHQIHFQGEVVDLDSALSTLVARVDAFLSSGPASLASAYRSSRLADISPGAGSGSSLRPPSSGTGRAPARLSNAQTEAIGVVGELIAFHWLRRHDPSHAVDESCWKSTNSQLVVAGAYGDDGLGYDFEVPRRHGSVMYEVKATSGEAGMIELGETEVRCAQQHARSDRWKLLVVEEALSAEPRVYMLPNPFRKESQPLFRFVGNSVRLRFTLDGN